jgi:hypothetical protein
MKFLFALLMQFLILTSAFGYCDQLYIDEINKLSEGLRTIGNSPAASQVMRRRDSLALVRDVLTDISRNNLNGGATQRFSKEIQVNPRTIQRILKRANKYNRLCEKGILLDHMEIGNLISSGKMF